MRFRKNEISLVVWIVYLVMVGVLIIFSGMTMKNELEVPLWLFLISCGGGLAVFGLLFFLSGGITETLEKDYSDDIPNFKIEERVFLVITLLGSIATRVVQFFRLDGVSTCFEIAKVGSGNAVLGTQGTHIKMVHASSAMYVSLLHELLKRGNNSYEVAAVMQIVLQLLGLFILFLGVRKMTGRFCSDVFLFLNAFLPFSSRMAVECTPDALFSIFFGAGLLSVCWFLKNVAKPIRKERNVIAFILCGLCIGIITYLDISGLCLLFLAAGCLNLAGYEEEELVNKGAYFTVILSTAVSIWACILVDALVSKEDFGSVFDATLSNYEAGKFSLDLLVKSGEVSMWIAFAFVCLGIFTYMKRKEEDIFSAWIITLAALVIMKSLHLYTRYQDNDYIFFVLLTVIGSMAISELLYAPCFERKVETQKNLDEVDLMEVEDLSIRQMEKKPFAIEKSKLSVEKKHAPQDAKVVQERTEGAADLADISKKQLDSNVEKVERRYIKNPLPLPKKKERKGLDYPLQVADEDMKFDIEVSDDDDFDLKDE